MATIVTRSGKGSPLTNNEVDANFTNLNTDKLESGDTAASLTITTADINGGTIDGVTIGGSSAGAITGTTGQFNTSLNVDGTVTADGLTVDGTGAEVISVNSTANGSQINFDSATTSSDWSVGIANDSTDDFLIYQAAAGSGDIKLYTDGKERLGVNNNGDISFYEDTGTTAKFFWDASAESLGIGTSSPTHNLHIEDSSTTQIKVKNTTNNAEVRLGSSSTGGDGFVGTASNDDLSIITNNSTRMTVDASGNVGIGTSSPSESLETNGNIQIKYAGSNVDPSGARYLYFNNTDTTLVADQPLGGLSWINNDASATAGEAAYVKAYATNNTGRAELRFGTGDQNAPAQAMVIDANGRVGIGTSSPSQPLHVDATGGTTAALFDNNGTNGDVVRVGKNGTDILKIRAEGTADLALDANGGAFIFKEGGSEAMRIDSSGNVGIGTTSITNVQTPTLQLGTNRGAVAIGTGDIQDNGSTLDIGSARPISFSISGSEKARIDSSGNVGLGVTPSAWDGVFKNVQIGGSGYSGSFYSQANGDISAGIVLNAYYNGGWKYTASSKAVTQYEQNNGVHKWFTAPSGTAGNAISLSEAMRIDSSGNVGIGTTSTATKLTVASASFEDHILLERTGVGSMHITATNPHGLAFTDGTTQFVTLVQSTGNVGIGTTSPSTQLHVNEASTNEAALTLSNNDGTYRIGANNDFGLHFADSFKFANQADTAEYMRITSAGNLGLGTTSPGRIVEVGGSQPAIKFNNGTHAWSIGTGAFVDGSDSFVLFQDGTGEALRVDSSGNLLVGTTTASGKFVVEGSGSAAQMVRGHATNASYTGQVIQALASRNTTNESYEFLRCSVNGVADRLKVYDNGNVENTNNSYGSLSDIKLKENVVDASAQWDDIKGLRFRKYNFKEETGQSTHTQMGLIAQEAELICPGIVKETTDRDQEGNDLGTTTKSIQYSLVYVKAVKALQEAMARIETLEAEVAALKGA